MSRSFGHHTAFGEMVMRQSFQKSQHYRNALIISAQYKYDTTFPGYGQDQYAREALMYLSNEYLQDYIHTEEPAFSFVFIFSLIYLEILSLDSETLSAFCITEKALEVEDTIRKEMEEVSIMRTEHYRKYGTFFERIKSYILN